MSLEKLLGRYSAEETEFMRQMDQNESYKRHGAESRGGFWKAGEKMAAKYDFLPSQEEMDEYIAKSLGRLFGNAE